MAGELGFDTGPFVNVAAFCERVVEEKDGTLTLVRLIDQFKVEANGPDAPDDLPPGAVVQATLVVMLKRGRARGGQAITVELEHPDASRKKGPETSINFIGGEGSGANLVIPMQIQLSSAGLYWADIFVNKRLAARAPLEVTYRFTRGPGTHPDAR